MSGMGGWIISRARATGELDRQAISFEIRAIYWISANVDLSEKILGEVSRLSTYGNLLAKALASLSDDWSRNA